MDAFELELKNDFLCEADEALAVAEIQFLDLEKSTNKKETLNTIFRLAHNLKGTSRAVGFEELADFTHKLESLLSALKDEKLALTPAVIDILLKSNDYLIQTVALLKKDVTSQYENAPLKEELVRILETSPLLEPVQSTGPVDPSVEPGSDVPLTFHKQNKSPEDKDGSIRVSLDRIEKLLNNVGELSILQAVMRNQAQELEIPLPSLMTDTLSSMSKIIKETQGITMQLRLLPIRQTFRKMERIVRDTAKMMGKSIELHFQGEETEIDKTLLDLLSDPMVHLIRNAVDHGIESAEVRKSQGKSETGNIYLSAYHQGGQVMLEVRDDGAGLDPEKLMAHARKKNILKENEILRPEEAYQLIFAPGFSTKTEVTDVSGRGVGMDVVKTNIAAIQGTIDIDTVMGRGTTFRIHLPLTTAIIDAILVESALGRYVIPLSQIVEFFKPSLKDISFPFDAAEVLTLREKTMNAVRLSDLLRTPSSPKKNATDLTALIIKDADNNIFAVLVDRILALQQVVIKPLSAEVRGQPGVMGSAILSDGKPALILDVIDLLKVQKKPRSNQRYPTKDVA